VALRTEGFREVVVDDEMVALRLMSGWRTVWPHGHSDREPPASAAHSCSKLVPVASTASRRRLSKSLAVFLLVPGGFPLGLVYDLTAVDREARLRENLARRCSSRADRGAPVSR